LDKAPLTRQALQDEAARFAAAESDHHDPKLYGVDNGKTVGTYLEHKFREHLGDTYHFEQGNSAKGIDFPELGIDLKVTSYRQPQSSCPFRSARQKIYGLGYAVLLLVYDKSDDHDRRTGRLDMKHTIFIDAHRTGDYTMTRIIREHLGNGANIDDLTALMRDRNLPLDEIEANTLAEEILAQPPEQGYLTISNALQWRLQYTRTIAEAGEVEGVVRL